MLRRTFYWSEDLQEVFWETAPLGSVPYGESMDGIAGSDITGGPFPWGRDCVVVSEKELDRSGDYFQRSRLSFLNLVANSEGPSTPDVGTSPASFENSHEFDSSLALAGPGNVLSVLARAEIRSAFGGGDTQFGPSFRVSWYRDFPDATPEGAELHSDPLSHPVVFRGSKALRVASGGYSIPGGRADVRFELGLVDLGDGSQVNRSLVVPLSDEKVLVGGGIRTMQLIGHRLRIVLEGTPARRERWYVDFDADAVLGPIRSETSGTAVSVGTPLESPADSWCRARGTWHQAT